MEGFAAFSIHDDCPDKMNHRLVLNVELRWVLPVDVLFDLKGLAPVGVRRTDQISASQHWRIGAEADDIVLWSTGSLDQVQGTKARKFSPVE